MLRFPSDTSRAVVATDGRVVSTTDLQMAQSGVRLLEGTRVQLVARAVRNQATLAIATQDGALVLAGPVVPDHDRWESLGDFLATRQTRSPFG